MNAGGTPPRCRGLPSARPQLLPCAGFRREPPRWFCYFIDRGVGIPAPRRSNPGKPRDGFFDRCACIESRASAGGRVKHHAGATIIVAS
jgi:hypothetical protein